MSPTWHLCPRKFRQLFAEAAPDTVGEVYYATRHGDSYTVRGLPIFSETSRPNRGSGAVDHFDETWLRRAVMTARKWQTEKKYAAPVHIDHTDDEGKVAPKRFRLAGPCRPWTFPADSCDIAPTAIAR